MTAALGQDVMHRTCDRCGAVGPVGSAKFMMNVGLIVMRFEQTASGQFCKSCVSKTFWSYTAGNLFLGWWGIKSFFYTLMFLSVNVTELLSARQLIKRQAAELGPQP
jgi:hypothetical protein